MNNKENVKKSKRLISAGVFIALYFVVFAIIGCCCMPVPILYLCMMSFVALLAAPVYQMLLAKAPMHGPIFIAAVLPCLFLLLQGNIWIVILSGIVAGLAAEITAGIGKFRNKAWNLISYLFFTQNLLCGFLPIWVMRDYYFQDTLERGMSNQFCDTLRAMTPVWVLVAMVFGTILCSIIGTVFGSRLIKKHLEKAGMV